MSLEELVKNMTLGVLLKKYDITDKKISDDIVTFYHNVYADSSKDKIRSCENNLMRSYLVTEIYYKHKYKIGDNKDEK